MIKRQCSNSHFFIDNHGSRSVVPCQYSLSAGVRPKNTWCRTIEEKCVIYGKTWRQLKHISSKRQRWHVGVVDALCSVLGNAAYRIHISFGRSVFSIVRNNPLTFLYLYQMTFYKPFQFHNENRPQPSPIVIHRQFNCQDDNTLPFPCITLQKFSLVSIVLI